jgi:hypothetical protein
MSSDYLKKPILAKKIESKCHSGLGFTSCEMQGKIKLIQDGEDRWKTPQFARKWQMEFISLECSTGMEDQR